MAGHAYRFIYKSNKGIKNSLEVTLALLNSLQVICYCLNGLQTLSN